MSETTPRLGLALLQAGQAQKEMTHNEALTLIDALLGGAVEAVGTNTPPSTPAPGQTWIVGGTPTGAWTDHSGQVALWTAGGWRFAVPAEGMVLRLKGSGVRIERGASAWGSGALVATSVLIGGEQVTGARLSGISGPGGGATIDAEARAAIDAILVALRTHGLIAT